MLGRQAQGSALAKVRRPRGIPPARAGLGGRGGASRWRPRVPAAPPRVPSSSSSSGSSRAAAPAHVRSWGGRRAARWIPPLHTPKSPRDPDRAPCSPPPQRPTIRPAGRRILSSGRPEAAAASAPPETKARRVARSARPGPGPPSPPPLCSPCLRAQRSAPSAPIPRLGGSRARGGAGARPRAGWGRGRRARLAPPPPPHFLPRYRSRKLRRAGAAARPGPGVRRLSSRAVRTLRQLCARGARPRLRGDSQSLSPRPSGVSEDQEVAPVALRVSAWAFGKDRPYRGHRPGRGVPQPLGPSSGPRGIIRGRRRTGRRLSWSAFPSYALARDPQEAPAPPRPRTKAQSLLFCNPEACYSQLPGGQVLASEMEYVTASGREGKRCGQTRGPGGSPPPCWLRGPLTPP